MGRHVAWAREMVAREPSVDGSIRGFAVTRPDLGIRYSVIKRK